MGHRPLVLWTCVVACAPGSEPSPEVRPTSADTAPVAPTVSASRLDRAPSPAAEPSLAGGIAPAPPDAVFQLAAYRDGELSLHLVGERVLIAGGGALATLDPSGSRLADVEHALLGQSADDRFMGGRHVISLGGPQLDAAWLVTLNGDGRTTSPPHVYRRQDDAWQRVPNRDRLLYWYYAAIVPWRDGQVLGLREYLADPDLDPGPDSEAALTAQRKRLRIGFDRLGQKPSSAPLDLAPGVEPVAVAVAVSGELFLLGRSLKQKRVENVVQRWDLDASRAGVLDVLPGSGRCERIAARAVDDVHAGCSSDDGAVLLRFDGKAWSPERAPDGQDLQDLALGPGDDLFAITSGPWRSDDEAELTTMWRRPTRDGAWEPVALPEVRFPELADPAWRVVSRQEQRLEPGDPAQAGRAWPVSPLRVLAHGGEVWVVGRVGVKYQPLDDDYAFREVVLRDRRVDAPLRMLSDADLGLEVLDWAPAKGWTPADGCPDDAPAFVAVRTLPPDAPLDQPEPALEALIRDHAAVMASVDGIHEVYRRGQRTLGLLVRPADPSAADALLAALTKVAPGETRALECRRPRIRRAFDRTTGRVIEAPAR